MVLFHLDLTINYSDYKISIYKLNRRPLCFFVSLPSLMLNFDTEFWANRRYCVEEVAFILYSACRSSLLPNFLESPRLVE